MIIVGAYSNAHGNDKQEFIPTIESVPDELSKEISVAVAGTGYFSEKNIIDCTNLSLIYNGICTTKRMVCYR